MRNLKACNHSEMLYGTLEKGPDPVPFGFDEESGRSTMETMEVIV